mmetsp:Transcript_59297/g.150159  ORF Transcript_59297/g.150159 Transcript_59297/m.150159 type:complete len:423 (+) Transcript_59297:50-1318(+)
MARLEEGLGTKLAAMGEPFDHDLGPRKSQLKESVLVIVAGHRGLRLRCDTPSAARDDPRRRVQEIHRGRLVVQLLDMRVTRYDQVNAVLPADISPVVRTPTRREVRHHDLPFRWRGLQAGLQPLRLLCPQLGEPTRAIVHARRTLRAARGVLGIVNVVADIVADVVGNGARIKDIAVHEEVVHREAGVDRPGPPVLRRCHPAAAWAPRVADGLVPRAVEQVAAIVVVSKYTQPRFAVQSRPFVDLLEVGHPLLGRMRLCLRHWLPAAIVNACPVEVVANVEDVVWITDLGSRGHLSSDLLLRAVVDAHNELTCVSRKLVRPPMVSWPRNPILCLDAAPVSNDKDRGQPVGIAAMAEASIRHVQPIVVGGVVTPMGDPEAMVARIAEVLLLPLASALIHVPLLILAGGVALRDMQRAAILVRI